MLTCSFIKEYSRAKLKIEKGKIKDLQPRIFYFRSLSFKFEAGFKRFSDKQKLREFTISKPALQDILKAVVDRNDPKAK